MSSSSSRETSKLIVNLLHRRGRGEHVSIEQLLSEAGMSRDPASRASLIAEISRRLQESRPATGVPATSADGDRDHPLPEIPGYDLIEEVGRGGMGVVYEGYQQSTGRRVAVKFISEHVASKDTVRRRFEREIELVARLQHPGIVSVLDSGAYAGHRYCVQEFVDGVTLDVWLRSLNLHTDRSTGNGREVALNLLAEVCDAVEYAHQRGVLHRDLKPSNILIDGRGQPHIVDFGLAKDIDPLASQWRDQTVAEPGEILGTLGYMAPEQSSGRHERISIRSDIYSLGAIAYEALTGRLPCPTKGTLQELLARIEREDPPTPSSINRSLSADLDAVLLRALDKQPERRYASAAELRDDIKRVVLGEPVRARPVGRLMRTVRWARRRPSQAALLSALIVFIMAGVASGLWMNARRVAIARAVEDDLREIAQFQQRSAWIEARAVLERAQVRIDAHGYPDLRQRLDEADKNLTLVARLDAIRMDRANFVGVEQSIAPQIDTDYSQAMENAGLAVSQIDPAVLASQVQASPVRAPIDNALMDWASFTADPARRDWLQEVARKVDPVAWRDRMNDPEAWEDPAALAEWARTAPVSGLPVQTLVALGERLHARKIDAVPFLRRVQRQYPGDFWANFYLGTALVSNPTEAVAYYRAALALRPNAAPVHNNLAMLLAETGNHDEAFDHFEAAARLTDYPSAHFNLGNAFRRRGDHAKAVMHYERAVQGGISTYALHHNYGAVLKEGGRMDEAIAQYRQALQLNRKVPAIHIELAEVLGDLGKLEEAIGHVREAARLTPKDWKVLSQLHPLLLRQQKWEEARAAWKRALEAEPPDHTAWYGYAELCLFLDQEAEYRLARKALLERFGSTSDPLIAERIGRACLLLPATGDELLEAASLCDRAVASTTPDVMIYRPYFLFAKGLAEYRQDRPDRAITLMKGEAAKVLGPAPRLVLAMSQHRMGQHDESAKTLADAVASFDWSDSQAIDDSTVWVFHALRREAESLIQEN